MTNDSVVGAPRVKAVRLTDQILDYVRDQVDPPTPAQSWLARQTHALGEVAEMQIPHEQGALLTLLAKLTDAKTIVEVGTFTGYSTLALARGLSSGGTVVTCDISSRWLPIAQRAWEEEGVAQRIDFRHGPATNFLRDLPLDLPIDLAFIDADKVSYIGYWDLLVPHLRRGGLIVADNALYGGAAASPAASGNAKAIRDFNAHVLADRRVDSVLLTVADGLCVARRKDDDA